MTHFELELHLSYNGYDEPKDQSRASTEHLSAIPNHSKVGLRESLQESSIFHRKKKWFPEFPVFRFSPTNQSGDTVTHVRYVPPASTASPSHRLRCCRDDEPFLESAKRLMASFDERKARKALAK